jgi:hypothetical protein
MSRTYQAVRIDSKFRTRDSASGSDFVYQLPENLECQAETIAFISGVTFPFCMRTIEAGYNDRLYFRTFWDGQATDQWLIIPPDNYDGPSFASMLQQKLNELWGPIPEDTLRPTWSVEFDYSLGSLLIQWGSTAPPDSPDRSFEFVSDHALMHRQWDWNGPAYDPQNPMSCGNVMRIETEPYTVVDNEVFQTGVFDSSGDFHVCYLVSDLCSYQSVGPQPSTRNVICRIPIDVTYGGIVHYKPSGMGLEVFPVSKAAFRELRFRLVDDRNRTIPLHGNDMSLEIYFTSNPMFSSSCGQ